MQYLSHTHLTTLGGMSLQWGLIDKFKSFSMAGIIRLNQRLKVRLLTPAARANSDFNMDFIGRLGYGFRRWW